MTIVYKFLTREEDVDLTLKAGKIMDYYGRDFQLLKLAEESAEYAAAYARFAALPSDERKAQMLEEMADIALVLQQIVDEMPTAVGREFSRVMIAKADRQLARIAKAEEEATP
ncbi:hypothetical protein IAI58_19190 (plasmid) [Roseomonas marmotae]|uniref:hypothetical protein n=1 Tax=Roseomonas marmotae TaxID=2768161 RepID=UPI001AD77A88|nr:hypothetical protein [Roseomonas marmotae]QTI81469.1 hypothetical protein IAI58_19190 [Roseomonas marmotae]